MNQKDSRINQIVAHLTKAGALAASSVTDAVSQAGNVVGDKYKSVKMTLEMNQLFDEQQDIFTEIGETMFKIKRGEFHTAAADEDAQAPQNEVDRLLELAEAKQSEIDILAKNISDLSHDCVCQNCGREIDKKANFCSYCGATIQKNDTPDAE